MILFPNKHDLDSVYESIKLKEATKVLKKQDVKNTENKLDKELIVKRKLEDKQS